MVKQFMQLLAGVASFAAFSSMSTACWYIFHQPEVPKALLNKR